MGFGKLSGCDTLAVCGAVLVPAVRAFWPEREGLGLAFELFRHAQKLLQTYSPSAQVQKGYRFPAMFVMSCKTKPSASRRGPFKCRIRAREFRNFRSGQVLDFIGLIACDPNPTGRGTMGDLGAGSSVLRTGHEFTFCVRAASMSQNSPKSIPRASLRDFQYLTSYCHMVLE